MDAGSFNHQLSHKDEMRLMGMAQSMDLMLNINPKMPLHYARTFIEVAIHPGKGPTLYAKALGTTQPVISRVLQEIGDHTRHRDRADGLVDWTFAPHSIREKEFRLTPKGMTLMSDILDALQR